MWVVVPRRVAAGGMRCWAHRSQPCSLHTLGCSSSLSLSQGIHLPSPLMAFLCRSRPVISSTMRHNEVCRALGSVRSLHGSGGAGQPTVCSGPCSLVP